MPTRRLAAALLAGAALLASAAPFACVARAEEPAREPPAEPVLAAPPVLKKLVPAEVPPGTAFPAPEVTVVLELDLSAAGAVEAVRLVQGVGEPFDAAAMAAARRLEFEPGRLAGGEPVPVTITFRLTITAPPPAPPPPPPPVRLSGRLLERGTRTPLPSVPVAARAGGATLARATTGDDGRFTLEVPAASFRLVAVAPGHARLDLPVEARPGEERDETYYLDAEPSEYTAVVEGERIRREITRQVIPAEEVAQVAGTQGDTVKAVLNMPGVARTPFIGGQLVLRGSSPGDSAVFVEGVQIPLIYHFGGVRSTFAPRFLEALEFVPGNFAPDFGRLTGGVVQVKVRDPKTDMLRGEADVNLFDAGVAVEGPLSKSWSAGAAFRRSWIDTILPAVLPKDSALSFSSAPRFYDYQFLATWKPDDRDKARFLFFGSQDKLVALFNRPAGDPTITGTLQDKMAFHELQGAWSHVFSPALRHDGSLSLGLQGFDVSVGPDLFFNLQSRRVDGRSTWSWQALPWLEARGGIDFQYAWYDIRLNVPRQPQEGTPGTPVSTQPRVATSQTGSLVSPAAFAELRFAPAEGLDLLPSLRVDWASAIGRWSFDPRLLARWRVRPGTVLKAAAGLYQQPPDPGESARDIGTPGLLPQRSLQLSAGVEQELREGVRLEVTGFHKELSRQVVQNPAADMNPEAAAYLNEGRGRIYGAELLLRARFGERLFGWLAYTYQRSFRTDHPGAAERRFDFDQPHILTAVATWKASARWSFGGRFRLVSGNPYTPVTGAVYYAPTDVWVPLRGAVNTDRLETFYALDLRADRTWTFDRWRLSAYLDVQNVTNHGNQEGWQYKFDYSDRTKLTGLPILPIFGLKGEW